MKSVKILTFFTFFLLAQVGCTVSDPEMMELLQEIKAQNDKLLEEVEKMKSQLDALDGKYQVILASLADNKKELEALKAQIDALKEQIAQQLIKIDQLSAQLEVQGADIEKLSAEIAELKANCDELKALIEELLKGKSPVPTNGLIAWYPFNGNANDESGNDNHGIVNGATLTSDKNGKVNSAFSFDGVDDDISNANEFLSLNSDFTFSAWFKTNDINQLNQCILNSIEHTGIGLNLNHNYNQGRMNLFLGDGVAFWDLNGLGGIKNNFQNEIWYHIILIKQNDNYKVYLNGVLDIEANISRSLNFNNVVGFHFGTTSRDPGYEQFNGKLDDIAFWNRALSTTEISKIYKGEKFYCVHFPSSNWL